MTATLLQMADGDVRCGSCGTVFNALHTLVDAWGGATGPGPGEAEAPPAETAGGRSAPESLEFDVPETEWQRFFVAAEQDAPAQPDPGLGEDFEEAAEPVPAPAEDAEADDTQQASDDTLEQPALTHTLEEETSDTDTWQAFLRETDAEEGDDEPPFVIDKQATHAEVEILIRRPVEPGDGEGLTDVVTEESSSGPAVRPARPEVEPPETVLDWGAPPRFSERASRPPAHTGRWLAASTLAMLVLGGQLLHHYRDTLAANADYGPAVRAAYTWLGWPVYPAWPLEAYEMRDSKAIAERSAPGALDIVAEIAVTGRQPVGLPMVRVVLRDRWSSPVASGVFAPAQYLAEAQPRSEVYAPGSLIPVQISLKDPGSTAQGFEVDVCIPDRKLGLQCKAARDPFRH